VTTFTLPRRFILRDGAVGKRLVQAKLILRITKEAKDVAAGTLFLAMVSEPRPQDLRTR
jgi:hypothetical protein